MSFWSDPLTGTLIGGLIATGTAFGTQLISSHREGKRAAKAAQTQAQAEWDALQVRTVADLQEQLEAVATFIGVESGRPVRSGLFRNSLAGQPDLAQDLLPFSRAVMLCSRLEDAQLGTDIRLWLRELREAMNASPLSSATLFALRDRRIVLQDRLGQALKVYHQPS